MTVFAPLRLAHRETISPAQLGRTLCTEVAEQVPYWVAVLTPAERPLLAERPTTFEQTSVTFEQSSLTFASPNGGHQPRVFLLAALGSAVCTWQRNNCRGSSAGVLVDLDLEGAAAVHPVRLPAVHADALTAANQGQHLLDDVSSRLASVPNGGRDYALTRNYPALASRAGAQIIVRDGVLAEPSRDHAIDIAITAAGSGTAQAHVTWAANLRGTDELIRLWMEAVDRLATTISATTGSSAA